MSCNRILVGAQNLCHKMGSGGCGGRGPLQHSSCRSRVRGFRIPRVSDSNFQIRPAFEFCPEKLWQNTAAHARLSIDSSCKRGNGKVRLGTRTGCGLWRSCTRKRLARCSKSSSANIMQRLTLYWLGCSSDKLEVLLTRETVRDQPQYYIKTLSASSNGSLLPERLLSDFPHPYPSIRDLQREVIRSACHSESTRAL